MTNPSLEQLQSEVIRQEAIVAQALRDRDTWRRRARVLEAQREEVAKLAAALVGVLQPLATEEGSADGEFTGAFQ